MVNANTLVEARAKRPSHGPTQVWFQCRSLEGALEGSTQKDEDYGKVAGGGLRSLPCIVRTE